MQVKLVQGWKKQVLEGAAAVVSRNDKPVSSKEADATQAELFE